MREGGLQELAQLARAGRLDEGSFRRLAQALWTARGTDAAEAGALASSLALLAPNRQVLDEVLALPTAAAS